MIDRIGGLRSERPTSDRWGKRLVERHRTRRRLITQFVDVAAWLAATLLTAIAPLGDRVVEDRIVAMLLLGLLAGSIAVLLGYINGLHRGRYIVGSFDEVSAIVATFVPTAAAMVLAGLLLSTPLIPLWSAFVAGPVAMVLALIPRYALRRSRDAALGPDSASTPRMLVFGAGEAGGQIVRSLLRDSRSSWLPVAFIDDDPLKKNRSVAGVRVLGGRLDIARVARASQADCLLVAVPSALPDLKQELAAIAYGCGLSIRILPPLSELVDASVTALDIREITEADLLGRPQVDIDLEAVAGVLRDRVVLVTGAGGSIGSEICRQVKLFGPRELIMVDRDESALHGVQLSIEGSALLSDPSIVVADIRDRPRMREVFELWRPDVVFHAAALKHLPLLELHAEEGIKTNVWGTHHVLEAALDSGVQCFVNISTDKAADPSSVLGYTKLLAERLTAGVAADAPGKFVSVRFGNVLGSRGSVLLTFRAQIEAGGPVTVTHPDVTRYFMTTEESVQLVLQAAVIGERGEVLVLDMGTPVRIDDVARRLIAQSARPVEVRYTGLRPGEKLHERLVGQDEIAVIRLHPLIMHTRVPPIAASTLEFLDAESLRSVACGLVDDEGAVSEIMAPR
jgi:FlaA1/EpsC-like NDP-sugar epimerase